MKPATRKEKIRFAENAARVLKAMGIKHANDIREEMTSLIQEFEDKVTQLKLSLPRDFLKLSINEVHALGDRFPDVVDKWEDQKKENIKKSLKKNALEVQINLHRILHRRNYYIQPSQQLFEPDVLINSKLLKF